MVAHVTSRMKNHLLFVESAGLVDPALPVEFRIVGHGTADSRDPYLAALVSRVRALGLQDRFRFAPFNPVPARVLEELDILVHPTEYESFGRVAVEAMAAGVPVVAVRGGGVAETVDDGTTGLLVPPQDPEAMARALERLIRDAGLRAAMGVAGRRRAEERYSLPRCVEGVLRAYEAAMRRPLGPSRFAPPQEPNGSSS
jgi:glycosyltransferase involved in cell wall biosynthesis